ncbi:outer membrane protein assembly factor BamA [Candidatus Pelagibacter communis]|uniref:outer membrane protein assembly factor BamA n=1 Tax=Pelagibacter ubique TaxID=198252 RepID=UPI00094D0142|nr:outer membrane protein assembly factor BamA [Candidatus Pelagibacter ubique]|tara:strand:- start:955 stop:3201 length:2247 start_codon:yes stop_codon:yes gene_type:complete
MYKLLSKITSILIFTSTFAFAEILNKVNIEGNKRISSETIIVLGNIQINSDYDDNKINNVLKNLNDSNFFSDIKIDFKNGILNLIVEENPIIENIEITGIKNQDFKKELLENISLKNRMSFNEYLLQNDINLIQNIFKTSGFYFAKIKTKINKNDNLNSVQLIFDIDQGDRARIKEISFIGDKKIKDKKLLEVIASEEHKFWKFVTNKVYLNQSTINLDKRLLENYYRNKGYYKVNVSDSFVEYKEEGFKLIYNIDAGNQYYFNDLKLNLPIDYDSSHFKELEKIFNKLKGKKYSLNDFNLILKKIDKIASSKLYDFIDSKVDHEIFDNDKINITFNVIDSEKFYVERINISGNFQTIEEVIRNRLIVDEGDPLNTLLYNKSIDNIRALRIFKNVKSEIKDGSNENLKVIDVIVEEKPTGEISLAAGVGTSGSTIGGGITEGNFLGKGIKLASNLEVSKEAIKGKFDYTKPNFAYTENSLFTSIQATTSDYLDDFGYKVSNTGFSIGTEFEQYENLFFSPEVSFSLEDLETNSSASTQLKKQEGTYEDFYINYGINYDQRDSGYRATSGNKTLFFQEVPIVSGNNEITNTFIFTQYKSFSETNDMIGKASLYLKTVNSLDDSDVRVSKRGQVPYNRLRGFEKGKVGPIDNSDYVGGNYVTALNLSTNLPGLLSTVEILDFSYFIDIANVWGVDYDSSIDDSNKIRSSTGLGIDWLTPIGPLSFSFTKPITKTSTDKTESFRFNLGTTF